MAAPTIFNDTIKRGDTAVYQIAGINKAGGPLNLTGAVLRMYAKNRKSDPDASAVLGYDSAGLGGIVVNDAGNGLATLTIPFSASLSFTQDTTPLYYDVQVTEADGTVTTLVEGTLLFQIDVTQEA